MFSKYFRCLWHSGVCLNQKRIWWRQVFIRTFLSRDFKNFDSRMSAYYEKRAPEYDIGEGDNKEHLHLVELIEYQNLSSNIGEDNFIKRFSHSLILEGRFSIDLSGLPNLATNISHKFLRDWKTYCFSGILIAEKMCLISSREIKKWTIL